MNLNRLLAVSALCLGLLVGAVAAWKTKPDNSRTVTEYVDKYNDRVKVVDRVITKIETTKPDGTTETKTDIVEPVYPPVDPKPNYSVTATHPVGPADVTQVGVEVGRRIIGDVWGVVGWQEKQGVHVGVRVEF